MDLPEEHAQGCPLKAKDFLLDDDLSDCECPEDHFDDEDK